MRFLLLIIIAICLPSLSQAANIYEIKDVSVSIKTANQAQARDKAIIAAEKKAFAELQKRLVEAGHIDKPRQMSETQIINAVDSIDIKNEKISDKTYKATYNVTFSDAQVSEIFAVGYIEPTKDLEKFVVVPMVVQNGTVKMWKNDWWGNWREQKQDNIILPLGDLQDVRNVKEEDLAARNYEGLKRLGKRYGVSNIVIAKGEYIGVKNVLKVWLTRIKDEERTAIVYEYPGDDENISEKDLFAAAANDLIYRLGNEKLTDATLVTSAAEVDNEPALPKVNKDKAPPESIEETNVDDKLDNPDQPLSVLQDVGDNEKPAQSFEAAADQKNQLDIIVVADDLIAWNRIRNKLIETDGISYLQIKSFTAGHASITLGYRDNISSLKSNLAAQGLELSGDTKDWIIREKQ